MNVHSWFLSIKNGNHTKIKKKTQLFTIFVIFILENYFTLYLHFVWRKSKHFLPAPDIFIAINKYLHSFFFFCNFRFASWTKDNFSSRGFRFCTVWILFPTLQAPFSAAQGSALLFPRVFQNSPPVHTKASSWKACSFVLATAWAGRIQSFATVRQAHHFLLLTLSFLCWWLACSLSCAPLPFSCSLQGALGCVFQSLGSANGRYHWGH